MRDGSRLPEFVPDFFQAQRRARQLSAVLLVGIFLLLVPVVTIPLVFFYVEESCPTGSTVDCESEWVFNPLALALTAVGVIAYMWLAPRIALRLSGVQDRRVGGPTADRLANVVAEISLAAGVPTPHSVVIDDPSVNAFALPTPRRGTVAVTRGAVEQLSRRELGGVVAHEIGHLRNRDSLVVLVGSMAVALVVWMAGVATAVTSWSIRAASAAARGRRGWLGGWMLSLVALSLTFLAAIAKFLLVVVATPVVLLLRAALSRRREELADAAAVQYTRDPAGLRMALERVAANTTPLAQVDVATEALWLDSPRRLRDQAESWWERLLDSHPPIEERIEWLRRLEWAPPSATPR